VFWLSQFAASAVNGHPNDLFLDNDKDTEEDDLKGQAVFVLSQLPNRSGNDELLDVARHNKDPRVRAKALFWLGQSRDPRALDLFEEILRGKS
jgi:HEAT repeat protein